MLIKQFFLNKNFGTRNKVACVLVLMFFMLSACNSDSAADCFQNAGNIIREEVSVAEFTKITVFENVRLLLKQGPQIKVEIETGENLRNEAEAVVEAGRLLLRDTNNCNFVREYGVTKIYVTAPNIQEIRSSTGLKIESIGVLNYPVLRLVSENFTNSESDTTSGEFDLNLDTNEISILANGLAYFKLQGNTNVFEINLAAGSSRIDAKNLNANIVDFNHRGSNDILVSPNDKLEGVIRSTGDVISFNRPDIVQVEKLFKGELIFKD